MQLRWDIDDNEFQLALVEAIIGLPCITSVNIFTSYAIKSVEYHTPNQIPGGTRREPQRRGNQSAQEDLGVLTI